MRRFFEVFLFEDVPAKDLIPEVVYLEEVKQCDLYVGLFVTEYGFEDADGLSPTEREFNHATRLNKPRFIFLKNIKDINFFQIKFFSSVIDINNDQFVLFIISKVNTE